MYSVLKMAGLLPVLPMNVELIVIAIAIVYTAISILLQRKLSNPKRMREIQAKIQLVQKEMNAMLKDKAPQEQMMAKQKEVMPLMGESMKNSMKPMLVLLPMLLVVYYWLIPAIPLFAGNIGPVKELFFIVVFGIGMVAAIFIMLYDRKKGKQELLEMQNASEAAPNNQ